MKAINLNGYNIKATTDKNSQLIITIDHMDGSQVNNNGIDIAVNDTQWAASFSTDNIDNVDSVENGTLNCSSCKQSFSLQNSVTREYQSKDGGDSVFSEGHYDKEGTFVPDIFNGFGEDGYDCIEDSDSCTNCENKI